MSQDHYLSIKDFAQAAGVSVQSVYKRLNQVENHLNQYLNLIDGKKMLDISLIFYVNTVISPTIPEVIYSLSSAITPNNT